MSYPKAIKVHGLTLPRNHGSSAIEYSASHPEGFPSIAVGMDLLGSWYARFDGFEVRIVVQRAATSAAAVSLLRQRLELAIEDIAWLNGGEE